VPAHQAGPQLDGQQAPLVGLGVEEGQILPAGIAGGRAPEQHPAPVTQVAHLGQGEVAALLDQQARGLGLIGPAQNQLRAHVQPEAAVGAEQGARGRGERNARQVHLRRGSGIFELPGLDAHVGEGPDRAILADDPQTAGDEAPDLLAAGTEDQGPGARRDVGAARAGGQVEGLLSFPIRVEDVQALGAQFADLLDDRDAVVGGREHGRGPEAARHQEPGGRPSDQNQ
jgi:hypothetical protein